jgi:hypothetical protein
MKAGLNDPVARHCKVFLDDVDVTADCQFADEEAGIVHVLLRDEAGRRFVDPQAYGGPAVATGEKHGRVRIVVDQDWPALQEQAKAIADRLTEGMFDSIDDRAAFIQAVRDGSWQRPG